VHSELHPINERLLQFIWQHSLYNVDGLSTTDGEHITVIAAGTLNRDAGPDFLEARIRIGNTVLVGNIELHLKASDWLAHGHQHDSAYSNIILHVVYETTLPQPTNASMVVLKDRITPELLNHYAQMMGQAKTVPCAGQLTEVSSITKENWLDRLLAERWEHKLKEWDVMLTNATEDWRNLLYWRLAYNFGFKTNATPFLLMARALPLNILARHRHDAMQVEALLFGQAGFLEADLDDDYAIVLQTEYAYLRKKYKLTPIAVHLWKFLRMRPANFPTVRLAQFAALIHRSDHLFSKIIELHTLAKLSPLMQVNASSYWDSHYRFDEPHAHPKAKKLGKESVENIVINTVAPIQFLYASRTGDATLKEKAIELISAIKPERNSITDMWQSLGWKAANSSQSQAQIQLYNEYCTHHKCLDCAIGLSILKKAV
jgi:hypothetical protein